MDTRLPRRSFIKTTASAALMLTTPDLASLAANRRRHPDKDTDHLADDRRYQADQPWYKTVTRWAQVNIAETDPARYDIPWWRKYWDRTKIKGIIVNAGGIVAYYPTRIPLHRRAEYLGDRDLFGELCRAAHEDGIAVFARMDSSKAHEEFYKAHPDWFCVDVNGVPYKSADLFVTCVNSPYYEEHIPSILKEIATTYHPEGFTDNNWSGLGRESICYCTYCRKRFKDKTGLDIPVTKNWNDPAYRKWIRWNYDRRLEIWDLNNRVTREAGGPACIWSGMNGGSVTGQSRVFRDFREICKRAEILMLDDQARSDASGFQHNAETGKLVHGMLGWDKLIPESMAMYQGLRPMFRLASKPEPEARMWMIAGMAGGIQLWWHMLGASHEDRRIYHNPERIFRWHADHEKFLIARQPVASVGVVWSQQNTDFCGRDNPEATVELPWRGMIQALVRARIPYIPIHADDIDRDAPACPVLVLPNLAAMSNEQIAAVGRFVDRGGSLVATGDTSLLDEWGDPRSDYGLGYLFGAHWIGANKEQIRPLGRPEDIQHSYLRLSPDTGPRHEILDGFDETAILPYGGTLQSLRIDPHAKVLMTFIPAFPVFPPEKVYMRTRSTTVPGLVLNEVPGGGRIVFLPAGLDKEFARSNLPDHGNLLKNIVRWAAKDTLPFEVEGRGLVDCHLYRQPGRLVMHIVNLNGHGAWRQPIDEFIPIGPLQVMAKLSPGIGNDAIGGTNVHLLVSDQHIAGKVSDGCVHFEIASITDHEVAVIA